LHIRIIIDAKLFNGSLGKMRKPDGRRDVDIKKKVMTTEELKEMDAFVRSIFPDLELVEGYDPEGLEVFESYGYYFESISNFSYTFNSLYRYWKLIQKQIKDHKKNAIEQKKTIKGLYVGEREIAFDETDGVDIEKFPDFLMSSIITFEISILETFLVEFCTEIAKDQGILLDIEDRSNQSFLDKHLYWLRAKAGLEIDYDPEVYRVINAVRMVRNEYVHRIGSDIPEKAKKIIKEMLQGQAGEKIKVDEGFVEVSFENIAEFVKQVGDAYNEAWEERNESEG